ncbi:MULTISPECIES: AI-2E family transporter [Chitinophagaceae]
MQPTTSQKKTKQLTLLTVIILLGIFLFYSLIEFFTAFLGSIIFYVLTKGMMDKLTKKFKLSSSFAAILIIVVSFFVILLPVFFFVTLLYGKVAAILSNPHVILDFIKSMDVSIKEKTGYSILSKDALNTIPAMATKLLGMVVNTGVNALSSIVMMYFFLYFLLTSSNLDKQLEQYLPFEPKHVRMLNKELQQQTISNALGIPLIAVAQGLCGYVAYLIGGVPEAGFWGVLTGFASIIPVVGSAVIYVPIVIYLFANGNNWQGITVLAICLVILGTVDNVIRFVLAKKMADVHPIITVLGVVMGLKCFGLSGLIFGPLLISYFFIFYKMYYNDYIRDPDQPEVITSQTLAEKREEKRKNGPMGINKTFFFPRKHNGKEG